MATTLETVRNTIRQGKSRDNKTLQALEYYETGKEAYANKGSLTAYYAGGSLSSDGAITLTATTKDTNKGNINAIGEQIIGKDVALHADHSIYLQGAENTTKETTDYSNKGWSVGASFGPAQGGLMSIDASASRSKDKGTDILTTYTPT